MIVYVMRWTWMRFFPILLIGKDALHVKGPFWYIFKLFLIWDIFSMAWRTNVIFALSYKILSNDCSSFGLVIGIKRGREVQDLEIFSSYSILVPRSVMQLQFCLSEKIVPKIFSGLRWTKSASYCNFWEVLEDMFATVLFDLMETRFENSVLPRDMNQSEC